MKIFERIVFGVTIILWTINFIEYTFLNCQLNRCIIILALFVTVFFFIDCFINTFKR